jgi:enoyl-CoA hydratase/carnithine racemase
MPSVVKYEQKGAVAIVTLNRPDKYNAMSLEMFDQLIVTSEKIAKDRTVRAVVLTGEGKVFCSGMDIANFNPDSDLTATSIQKRTHGICNKWQKAIWTWWECPVPVIAAVKGLSYGAGLQLTMAADIKYVHPETRFSILEMKWGLIPDLSGTQLMRGNVREDIFKELTFTNRIFSAEEAVQYGFATHVSGYPMKAAMEIANKIATKNPAAIIKAKTLINSAKYVSAKEGLQAESDLQQEIMMKPDQLEAVYANMQKRSPLFNDYRDNQ